eukprot:6199822-Pleurochrysis_carterae.AAC.1
MAQRVRLESPARRSNGDENAVGPDRRVGSIRTIGLLRRDLCTRFCASACLRALGGHRFA